MFKKIYRCIIPKLTIYVCQEKSKIYTALYLSSFNGVELIQKLSALISVPLNQIRDVYMEGPNGIHLQLTNDLIRHIKEETMFSIEVAQDGNSFVLVLKKQ